MFDSYFSKRKLKKQLRKANKEKMAVMSLFIEGSWKKTDKNAVLMYNEILTKISTLEESIRLF